MNHTLVNCKDICQLLMVQRSGNLVLDQNMGEDCRMLLRRCSGGESLYSCMCAALVIEKNIYADWNLCCLYSSDTTSIFNIKRKKLANLFFLSKIHNFSAITTLMRVIMCFCCFEYLLLATTDAAAALCQVICNILHLYN